MSSSHPSGKGSPTSKSFVKADTRKEAIEKMVMTDPVLAKLYKAGKSSDGKAGWVNAIKDQFGGAYRLLFYVFKLRMAPEFRDREPYEVLYGEIGDHDEPNFPRMLFTTTGAINLMRDGIPSERFALDLLRSELELVPYERGKDSRVDYLRKKGNAYICIYDAEGQGIRVLDLEKFYEIFDTPNTNEIQVRNEEEVIVGDTKFVRPFLIRYAPKAMYGDAENPSDAAQSQLDRLSGR